MADKFKACSVAGCNKNAHHTKSGALGMCRAHYTRARRHGDPSITLAEPGAARRYFREVVLPYAGDECLVWPHAKNSAGQGTITLQRKGQLVTRAVCEESHGPPPSPAHHAAHSCGNGHLSCVTPKHLRWATPTENAADKHIHGTHIQGEASTSSKLTEANVIDIVNSRGKVPQKVLAKKYGVCTPHICALQKGKFWKHVTSSILPASDT